MKAKPISIDWMFSKTVITGVRVSKRVFFSSVILLKNNVIDFILFILFQTACKNKAHSLIKVISFIAV